MDAQPLPLSFKMPLAQIAALLVLLSVWAATLRRRGLPVISAGAIKFTHVLPASLQSILFLYWSLYWPPVLGHLPALALQLAFAYVFDLLLHWSLRRPYVPGLGPVPIVFSINLFIWFPDPLTAALAIALALTSKALLHRQGRHIFNPAVGGLTMIAVLCIGLPDVFRYQDVSHGFDEPPHMAHLVFLLALIPQIRLGIAPVAVGAAAAMIVTMLGVYWGTGYQGGPTPWWPAWLLAITLLAGDPATIPGASFSRFLFGLIVGVGAYVVSRLLLFSVGTDFFAKIIPIAMANLLVPWLDRAGARISSRAPAIVARAGNSTYTAIWATASLIALAFRSP